MQRFSAFLGLLRLFLITNTQCSVPASEFHLNGDYLIGGLFNIHHVSRLTYRHRPESLSCSGESFLLPNYRRFQLMRFAVEEINNSTTLLPNVSLGYEIFDLCSNIQIFPGIFKLISAKDLIQPWSEQYRFLSKTIGIVGPFTSTQSMTVAPLFIDDLIPMVSYGGTASFLSKKSEYPSFMRTVYPNKDTINVIVNILLYFRWRWVAFLNSDDDFGIDGLELFIERIKDIDICLAYNKGINDNTEYSQILKQIEANKVEIVIIFAPTEYAENVIRSAIGLKIKKKVWIGDDGWSLSDEIRKMDGITKIGTVLGVAQPVVTIPGFDEYVQLMKHQSPYENAEEPFCNQFCNCSNLSSENITTADPSFSFQVYSAVYALAHALHNTLKCTAEKCDNMTVHAHMILKELMKSNFTLLNQTIQFNEYGDPKFGSFSIVFWNFNGDLEEIGVYHLYPSVRFYINASKVQWYSDGQVPTAVCSPECPEGYMQKRTGVKKCCFNCEICPMDTYVNSSDNPLKCISCKDTEWSAPGSGSCNPRMVEYVSFTDPDAIAIMVMTGVMVGLNMAVFALFTVNYNTPVVRSAGGPMCFLILICLTFSSLSVFFYFGKPTNASCIMRYFPFFLFYTVCVACFVVRSFQIVCVFKMAAKIPKLHSWWVKYHAQWLLVTVAFCIQTLLLTTRFSYSPPKPYNETLWYQELIVLSCELNLSAASCDLCFPFLLCCLCFVFSYMGKDLPKNYNEAKAITFCLLLLIFTWIIFVTVFMLYHGKYLQTWNALAVLSSLYSFLLWYFLPKCYIIIFQPQKNTQQYFQSLIQNYTKTLSQ